jgi:hypothetical protein
MLAITEFNFQHVPRSNYTKQTCQSETKRLVLSQELSKKIFRKRKKKKWTDTNQQHGRATQPSIFPGRYRACVCVCVCVCGFCRYPSNGASLDLVSEWRCFPCVISPVITTGIPHALLHMLLTVTPYLTVTVNTVSPYVIANVANGYPIPYCNCHYSFPHTLLQMPL